MSVKFNTTTWNEVWNAMAGLNGNFLSKAGNLSDIANTTTARTNLGTPGLATNNTYTGGLNDFLGVRVRRFINSFPQTGVSDDGVLALNTGNSFVGGGLLFFACNTAARPAGCLYYRSTDPGGVNSHCTVVGVVNGGILTTDTGTPTGTTGMDARLNIFVGQDANAGILFFENRLGASIAISALVMQ